MTDWFYYLIKNNKIIDYYLIRGASSEELIEYICNNIEDFEYMLETYMIGYSEGNCNGIVNWINSICEMILYQIEKFECDEINFDLLFKKIGKALLKRMSNDQKKSEYLRIIEKTMEESTKEDTNEICRFLGSEKIYRKIKKIFAKYTLDELDIPTKYSFMTNHDDVYYTGIINITDENIVDPDNLGLGGKIWIFYICDYNDFQVFKYMIANSIEHAGKIVRNNLLDFINFYWYDYKDDDDLHGNLCGNVFREIQNHFVENPDIWVRKVLCIEESRSSTKALKYMKKINKEVFDKFNDREIITESYANFTIAEQKNIKEITNKRIIVI